MFARMMDEYGSIDLDEKGTTSKKEPSECRRNSIVSLDNKDHEKHAEITLMQAEERNIGSVPWKLYLTYLQYAGGLILGPFIIALLILTQGAEGTSKYLSVCS